MISKVQRHLLGSFFNNNGWVLDFNDKTMADFTMESVGFDIKEKYGQSKGAALKEFFLKEDDDIVLRMAGDLVNYMDTVLPNEEEYIGNQGKQYAAIKALIPDYDGSPAFDLAKIDFSNLNNDEYLTKLIDELNDNANTDPALVIGETRDLLEAVYKRILEHYHKEYSENDDMTKLSTLVNEELGLTPNYQVKATSVGDIAAKILGNLFQVAKGMDELRNKFGRGHGRGSTQIGAVVVPRRYADLAVGTATVLINFLTETVKYIDEHKEI